MRDERGRFPASAALFDPEAAAADRLVERFREIAGAPPPGPAHGGAHPRHRHAVAVERRPRRGRGRRTGQGGRRAPGARGSSRASCAAWPACRATGPAAPTPTGASSGSARSSAPTAASRPTSSWPATTTPPTAPRRAVYERVRPAVVTQVLAQGDELGLHPSYTASEDVGLIAEERARLEALAGGPVRGVRFHYLRHDAHATLPELDRLGFAYDSSQGYADRPGMRAGLSSPLPAVRRGRRPAARHARAAARRHGRHARRGPLPRPRGRRRAWSGRSRRSSGRPGPAARSRSSGTTTASIRPTRAAGTGPTTACWGGCASAAGGCARPAEAVGLDAAATPRR